MILCYFLSRMDISVSRDIILVSLSFSEVINEKYYTEARAKTATSGVKAPKVHAFEKKVGPYKNLNTKAILK